MLSLPLTVLLGLALGSFVNALVWRLRQQEKGTKESDLKRYSILQGRSMCIHCKHELAWFDLIPVVSWLQLGGKCRYCKKPISWQYPFVELGVALLAAVSLLWWPFPLATLQEWLLFGVWIVTLAPMTALVIYDIRWMEMPTRLIYSLNVLGVLFVSLRVLVEQTWDPLVSGLLGALLLGGFFWLIYQFSDGKWIGGGDVRFGFPMGLFLGWQKMLFGITLASYLGVILIIVLIALRKYHKKMRVPFGPFLITATYLSMLFGQQIVDIYKNLAGF